MRLRIFSFLAGYSMMHAKQNYLNAAIKKAVSEWETPEYDVAPVLLDDCRMGCAAFAISGLGSNIALMIAVYAQNSFWALVCGLWLILSIAGPLTTHFFVERAYQSMVRPPALEQQDGE